MPEDGKCRECGHLNQAGAAFCGNCGSPLRTHRVKAGALPSTLPEEVVPLGRQGREHGRDLERAEAPALPSQACPSCHSPAGTQDLFCRNCGARLVIRPAYCKRCGDPIDPDERLCNRCGLPLG
jgi:predicted amidophosphoribosyltransferase